MRPQRGEGAKLWSAKIRVAEEVGRGAMGYVLRGIDTKLRREVALKVSPLPKDQLPREQLARFIEEAQITAQLEHPNVVPIHDIGLDPDGRVYFSMKLIRGQPLDAILDKRREGDVATLSEFGLRRLLDVFLQVCQAVEYAHARGVIHRDLKPANIMVGDFGEVLVMDWGVAKLKSRPERAAFAAISVDQVENGRSERPPPPAGVTSVRAGKKALATQMGTVVGTPAYMSPEQARGLSVDERADVYALGIILYEILCGDVPFDDEDPRQTLKRVLAEAPRAPSKINPATPLALETLALRLLEKDPDRRTPTIQQIRTHVQDYIEGIGRDFRRESLWTNGMWIVGALGLFAFLVWYLTGQSIASVVALAPPAVLNAVGWFLVVMALGYPLWAAFFSFRQSRIEHDRFRPPNTEEVFVSGFLAHRTFAAALAPVFQLVFVLEVVAFAVLEAFGGVANHGDLMQRTAVQLRAEWSHALIIVLVFLFAYLFLLSTEVRFARRVERYELLVERPAWESIWPSFLILVLLITVTATDILHWAISTPGAHPWAYVTQHVLTRSLNLFEILKNVVFQGTFLLGLVVATVLVSFPFAELLASLRMPYQPADEASVFSRQNYFLRSIAIFRVARANWLYGGAMIGSLSAITVFSQNGDRPLIEQVFYILGPSLIGFAGYWITRRRVLHYLAHSPAVQRMVEQQVTNGREQQTRANLEHLKGATWRERLLQLTVPIACVIGYLLWTGSGLHHAAVRQLMMPASAEGWLLILPFALLFPLLLIRDQMQLRRLRRRDVEPSAKAEDKKVNDVTVSKEPKATVEERAEAGS